MLTRIISDLNEVYQILDFPARSRKVALFVDDETESQITIDSVTSDGRPNTFFVQLYLYNLNISGRALNNLGLLTSVYVVNVGQKD